MASRSLNSSNSIIRDREFVEGWTFAQTLGEGAYGEVKLLINTSTGNAVALKMIDLKKHPDATDSVKKEVCIQKSLHDSHILQLYGCRTQGDIEYIFLEYAAGGELFDRIEPDIGMVPKQAQQFFTQLMAGVEYLHNRGIAHRDLKPENLLLDEHDNLKISDFGMATMFRCKGKERLLDKRCGTLPYVAPEVLSKPYKAMPADLWSCGIILVTMLAGELPWDQPTEACIDYTKWEKSSDWSTSMPWKKLDTMSLSLIRNMLKCTPKDRYTLEQIKNHVWYRSDLRGSDSLDGSLLNPSNPMEKRHCSNHRLGGSADDLFGRDICSQPNPVPNENNPMDVAIEAMNDFCFSQPAMIDDIILCTQQNLTQTASQNQFQRLVRRMTRFYVASSAEEAGKNLLTALAKLNYNVKSHDDGVVTISTLDRKKSPLIFKANVIEMNGKILLDFRLSKGCGLEFKRDFIKIKNLLSDHIVKCSINWPLGNKC